MLAIFSVPLSSFVKLKRNNIPWVNGPWGKARLTFAYRGGTSELTGHSQRLDSPTWTTMNRGCSMTLASSNWENRQFSVTSASVCNGTLTSTDCATVSKRVIWACHPTLLKFSPTLHQNTQYSGGNTHNNDDQRGREDLIGHILRQIWKKALDVPRLYRLLEFIGKLAFSGHP